MENKDKVHGKGKNHQIFVLDKGTSKCFDSYRHERYENIVSHPSYHVPLNIFVLKHKQLTSSP